MNRLGLLDPAELKTSQLECYQMMKAYTDTNYADKGLKYMDDQSRLIGPFGIVLHSPELATAFAGFAKALRTIPGLPSEARECAILGVGCRFEAAYEQYAHELLSGFSDAENKLLRSGNCPEHFSQAQKIAFKVALEMGKPGPLSKASWDEAIEILGRDGTMALIHYVGFYSYVSTILNGFDAKVPQ